MDPVNIGGITVAIIAAASAIASSRAASRATISNTNTTSRVDMEREAYTRAREFDVQTIKNQNGLIAELRRHEEELLAEVRSLRRRVARLERELVNNREDVLHVDIDTDDAVSE